MKLGFGFYRHMLNDENYAFARQCGATHAVVHLVDYKYKGDKESSELKDDQPVGDSEGWGIAGHTIGDWNAGFLKGVKSRMADFGLEFHAIENFDPVDWYDVLTDGPKRDEQMAVIKERIRMLGAVGIPVMGYNFSLTSVASRISGTFARGGAVSVGMSGVDERPLPPGMVWNMWVSTPQESTVPSGTEEDLWDRWQRFMNELLPVAKESGVILAAHPDDPPVRSVRGQPKLGWNAEAYESILDRAPSPFNRLELCLGTVAEMPDHDIYAFIERVVRRDGIGYIHLRNVVGTAPDYREVFIDEGKLDMRRIVRLLREADYQGVLIPDHTPQMSCKDPWHAGMAYAMGYMKALLNEEE